MTPTKESPAKKQAEFYSEAGTDRSFKHRDTIYDDFSVRVCAKLIERRITPVLLARGITRSEIRWLDVGCGLAIAARAAARLGIKEYVGVDITPRNIEYCRSHSPHNQYYLGDFLTLELPSRFNLVTFFSSLHHFADWRVAIDRARGALSGPGVILVEQEPAPWYARLYTQFLRWRCSRSEFEKLREIEVHWMKHPSIRPRELPAGTTIYHADFIPFFRRLGLRTTNRALGAALPLFRKIIPVA